MARVVLVTGRGFRHLWFIELARRALGEAVAALLVQSAHPPEGPQMDQWSRLKRSVKRTLGRMGLQVPVFLDLTPAERYLWLDHGEPPLNWRNLPLENVQITSDPNSESSITWLEEVNPDLVLVFGGRILSAPWYARPRLGAMNLHYGIIPDYRGSESVVWAAYHRNWDRIGATIHYLDAGIDTGPIIAKVPAAVRPGDNLDALTARVYWSGLRALLRCAEHSLRQDSRLPAVLANSNPEQFYPAKLCTYEIRQVADANIQQRAGMPRGRDVEQGQVREPNVEAGLRRWSRSLALQPRAADRLPAGVYIFLYHDLSPAGERPWGEHAQVSTTPERFGEHLRYLADHGTWVAPEAALARLQRNQVEEPLFVLTFDDGFASVYHHGRASIAELGIRPLLFVNGASAAGRGVHYRLLAAILAQQGRADTLVQAVCEAAPYEYARRPPAPRQVLGWLKQNYDHRWTDRVVAAAYCRHNQRLPTELFLNERQLRELLEAGWILGNHTWSHARLARLSPPELADELERNEQWLRGLTGRTPEWIAYPYGFRGDVGPAAVEWVERNPDRVGLMADGGVNFALQRTMLRRIPLADGDLTEFRQTLHQSILRSQQEQFRTVLGAV